MMLKKFLRRTFSREDNTNRNNYNFDPPVLDLDAEDRETDDFLLIGSTLSERKAVKPNSCIEDFPPSYDSLFNQETMGNAQSTGVNKPPTPKADFEDDCAMLDVETDTPSSNMISQNNIANLSTNQTSSTFNSNTGVMHLNSHAVYEDIPFTLSPVLIAGASLPSMQAQLDNILRSQPKEDLQNFNYEFTLEQSVIRGATVK